MDALTYIVGLMAAILFGWIGYFLGNLFPVLGKAKERAEDPEESGEVSLVLGPIQQSTRKVLDWLLEREDEPTENLPEQQQSEDLVEPPPAPRQEVVTAPIPSPENVGKTPLILWHGRREKKLIAKFEDSFVDLDGDLTPEQHGSLSMLLIDLQEHVGLSATLREAISEGADKVMMEHARSQLLPPKESEVKPPSFNPLKSLVNYVQPGASKLPDSTASIPDQINANLQQIIRGTALEGKRVSMVEWPNRGTVFIVGVDVYEDIHKIPDPEIRQAIRQAVERWEKTQDERWGIEGN